MNMNKFIEKLLDDIHNVSPELSLEREKEYRQNFEKQYKKSIAEKIIEDFRDRRGFDGWWCDIDEDIQEEILLSIVDLLPDFIDSKK